MPGFTSSYYKDGKLPTSTKAHFIKYNIMTVHSIICKNTLMLLVKASYFADQVPPSIIDIIIQSNKPNDESQLTVWNDKFGYGKYRNSFFFKGPLLREQLNYPQYSSTGCLASMQLLKKRLKNCILEIQGSGDIDEWLPKNNLRTELGGGGPRRYLAIFGDGEFWKKWGVIRQISPKIVILFYGPKWFQTS